MFGYLLSNLIYNLIGSFHSEENINIIELGAGNGTLAYDIKKSLNTLGCKNFSYEPIDKLSSNSVEKIYTHNEKKIEKANGIIISNELFDALPHHLYEIKNNEVYEKYVIYKNNKYEEILDKPSDSCISKRIKKIDKPFDNVVGEVYCSENTIFDSFIDYLNKGYILTIDYGLNEKDLFYNGKKNSNVSVINDHNFYENYFHKPGFSDITFQVDINELLDNFKKINYGLSYLGNQREFLFNLGIGEILGKLSSMDKPPEEINYNRYAINQLIKPNGMGSYFVTLHSNFDTNFKFSEIKLNENLLDNIPLIEDYPQRFELPGVYKKNNIIREGWK